jgi:hypothetical protein
MKLEAAECNESWANEEFGAAMLTDVRHIRRLVKMAAQLADHPAATVYGAFRADREARPAYEFLEHKDLEWRDIADASHRACAARAKAYPYVFVAIDGSSWTYTDTGQKKGFGPIGTYTQGARGIKVMTAYAFEPDGVPLGVLAQELWVRPNEANPVPHSKRALEDKESRYWTLLQQQAEEQLRGTGTQPWYLMDREADQISVLLRTLEPTMRLTVRADKNRCLAEPSMGPADEEILKVFELLDHAPVSGMSTVAVRRSAKRRSRTASVEVSFTEAPLKLRQQRSKLLVTVTLTAVRVRELECSCPTGEERLDWILYTTYPVEDLVDALEVVRGYALRWRIERFHHATKTGAGHLTESQLRSFSAMAIWITLHVAVAGRLEHLLYRARTEPDVPAALEFSKDEIDATILLHKRHHTKKGQTYSDTPSLGQLVIYIAQIGGFAHTKQNKWPGIVTFQRGMMDVVAVSSVLPSLREQGPLPHGARDGSDA